VPASAGPAPCSVLSAPALDGPVSAFDLLPTEAADGIDLATLIHHRHHVDHLATLEDVYRRFRDIKVEFCAVVREDCVLGLCARSQVGFIMGSRFGFALYSGSTVHTALVEELFLRVKESRPDLARRFVFVTGHAGGKLLENEIASWGVPVLAKPFTLLQLSTVCRPYLEENRLGADV